MSSNNFEIKADVTVNGVSEKYIKLLELVDENHALYSACKQLPCAYSHGWEFLKTYEKNYNMKLIENISNKCANGSNLTKDGLNLINKWHEVNDKISETIISIQ